MPAAAVFWALLLLASSFCFENVGRVANSNLTLKWKFVDDYIEVKMEWQQPTFVGIMLGDTMINNDLWLCSLEPNSTEWAVLDRWSVGYFMPLDDTDDTLKGRDDLENKFISVNDTAVVCSFRRKMITNDRFDLAISKGDTIHVCSSKSWTVNLVKHHHSKYCFYWPILDGFDGELTEEIVADNTWPLIHGIVMSVCWGVLVDFGVSTARYFKLRGHYVVSHAVFFAVVALATIPMAVLMVVRNRRDLLYNFEVLDWTVQVHFILGVVLIAAVIAQYVVGLLTKSSQERHTSDKGFIKRRLVHRIIGYSTYVLTKLQLVLGWWIYQGGFWLLVALLLGWYGILAVLHCLLEWLYRKNKLFLIRNFQRIEKHEITSEIKSLIEDEEDNDIVASVNAGKHSAEIVAAFPKAKYVLFKDFICQLDGFKHPGGQFIFERVIGKDISKYIYGSAAFEEGELSRHEHSGYALKYLQSRSIGVRKNLASIISQDWYQREVHQLSKDVFRFVFTNPSFSLPTNPKDIQAYLGRHWLIRSNGLVRPYTVLLSQLQCNIEFRSKLLEAYEGGLHDYPFKISKTQSTSELVLIIKRYQQGAVSRTIHDNVQSIQGLYGLGLELEPGLNIIITGGTGVLPFLDLFDLLLKKAIALIYREFQQDDKYDPYSIGYCNVLNNMSFRLFASFTTAEQFSNYHWLVDLHRISKQHKLGLFELQLKVPGLSELQEVGRFYQRVNEELVRMRMPIEQVSKVYLCGPPPMNVSLLRLLTALNYPSVVVL